MEFLRQLMFVLLCLEARNYVAALVDNQRHVGNTQNVNKTSSMVYLLLESEFNATRIS